MCEKDKCEKNVNEKSVLIKRNIKLNEKYFNIK